MIIEQEIFVPKLKLKLKNLDHIEFDSNVINFSFYIQEKSNGYTIKFSENLIKANLYEIDRLIKKLKS